jgi:hypothetical protein
VHRVQQDHREIQALLVHREPLELQERKDHRVQRDHKEIQVHKVLRDQKVQEERHVGI